MADDGVRFIYALIATSATAATFWRYDTWWGGWQQLATPPTTTITVGKIIYAESVGKQLNGQTFGSILSLQANGTVAYWYRYDIATNAWSTLSITNVPASTWARMSIACTHSHRSTITRVATIPMPSSRLPPLRLRLWARWR